MAKRIGSEDPYGPGPAVIAADTLEGDRVVNRRGEELGIIEDLMIDVRRGTVAYVLMSRGGACGRGERCCAVPWNALAVDAERRCFVLDEEPGRLAQAPAFDRNEWPSLADEGWASEVHAFYHVEPYWTGPHRSRVDPAIGLNRID